MSNLGCVVQFDLDGLRLKRRLVDLRVIDDPATELSVESPVGRALLAAAAGDELVVKAPAGDVVVKVRSVA
jgi:transcription elongation GreA/GreB family factor